MEFSIIPLPKEFKQHNYIYIALTYSYQHVFSSKSNMHHYRVNLFRVKPKDTGIVYILPDHTKMQ